MAGPIVHRKGAVGLLTHGLQPSWWGGGRAGRIWQVGEEVHAVVQSTRATGRSRRRRGWALAWCGQREWDRRWRSGQAEAGQGTWRGGGRRKTRIRRGQSGDAGPRLIGWRRRRTKQGGGGSWALGRRWPTRWSTGARRAGCSFFVTEEPRQQQQAEDRG